MTTINLSIGLDGGSTNDTSIWRTMGDMRVGLFKSRIINFISSEGLTVERIHSTKSSRYEMKCFANTTSPLQIETCFEECGVLPQRCRWTPENPARQCACGCRLVPSLTHAFVTTQVSCPAGDVLVLGKIGIRLQSK